MSKTISFTIMHFAIAFSVTYALTGDWAVGSAVALIEPAVNSVGYFFHERLWERLKGTAGRPEKLWSAESEPGSAPS